MAYARDAEMFGIDAGEYAGLVHTLILCNRCGYRTSIEQSPEILGQLIPVACYTCGHRYYVILRLYGTRERAAARVDAYVTDDD